MCKEEVCEEASQQQTWWMAAKASVSQSVKHHSMTDTGIFLSLNSIVLVICDQSKGFTLQFIIEAKSQGTR